MARLPFRDRLQLSEALNKVCRKSDDGFAVYADGWSDGRVAQEAAAAINPAVNVTHVANMRQEIFGLIRPAAAPKPKSEPADELLHKMQEHIAELSDRIEALTERVKELEKLEARGRLEEGGRINARVDAQRRLMV
jgi:hypothetical protein